MFGVAENSQGVILLTLIMVLSDCSWICCVAKILDKWLGSKITVVALRGKTRVTVTIGDCQALVSSSWEALFRIKENSQGVILSTLIIAFSDHSWIHVVAEILDKWLGSKIKVVVSRGIIRVTVTISDCQRVCLPPQRGVWLCRNQSKCNLINLDYRIERS